MAELSVGVSVAVVGMVGTIIALSIIGGVITLIHRAFPFVESTDKGRAEVSKRD